MEIDALPRLCAKGHGATGPAPLIWGHHHKKGIKTHRDECLTAIGMALYHLKLIGQDPRLGFENADPCTPIREIDLGTVMKPPAKALIDDLIGLARSLQNIAKRRKGLRRDGGNLQMIGHVCSLSISVIFTAAAMRSMINSINSRVFGSCLRRCV